MQSGIIRPRPHPLSAAGCMINGGILHQGRGPLWTVGSFTKSGALNPTWDPLSKAEYLIDGWVIYQMQDPLVNAGLFSDV